MEKKYQLRKMKAIDLIKVTKLFNKIKLKELVMGVANDSSEKNPNIVVIELGMVITENLYKCEEEFFDFISNLTGIKSEVLKEEVELQDLLDIVDDLSKDEGLINFITSIFKKMGKK